ncbi:hypothetical protein BDF22DRAFT_740938 [Syncephalis plumigaleata]|nr:hypothetical protein BDF22DRAFT_740938 [Syncephalis plumigaleata]
MLVSIRRVFAVASMAVILVVAAAGLVNALPASDDGSKSVAHIAPEGPVTPKGNTGEFENSLPPPS